MVQLTGETAPDCASIAEYNTPASPSGKAAVVITGLDLIVICRFAVSLSWLASSTVAPNEEVPGSLGVPPITPGPLRVSPVGSAPLAIDHVYGDLPPVAERVCE